MKMILFLCNFVLPLTQKAAVSLIMILICLAEIHNNHNEIMWSPSMQRYQLFQFLSQTFAFDINQIVQSWQHWCWLRQFCFTYYSKVDEMIPGL